MLLSLPTVSRKNLHALAFKRLVININEESERTKFPNSKHKYLRFYINFGDYLRLYNNGGSSNFLSKQPTFLCLISSWKQIQSRNYSFPYLTCFLCVSLLQLIKKSIHGLFISSVTGVVVDADDSF